MIMHASMAWWCRPITGTTKKYPRDTVMSMSMSVLPYTNVKIQTKKTFEAFKDDTLEVMEARHHLKGYTGHVHASQVDLINSARLAPL